LNNETLEKMRAAVTDYSGPVTCCPTGAKADVKQLSRRARKRLAKMRRAERRKAKRHKKSHRIIIPGLGDPCPRCHQPMQIREHETIRAKQLRQPFFYSRWFCCMNPKCRTKQVMPERFKVVDPVLWSDERADL
jgi:hypothetical protein